MDSAEMKLHQKWNCKKTRNFQEQLLHWYGRHKRELPWRSHPTPYRVWVSEIMLQQTQAKTVLPYYDRFFKRFPDIQSLSRASEQEVLALWAGLGYYGRARNLHRAARQVVDHHGGEFPDKLEEILMLPGIGRYTAGAICSIAFNRPLPIVEGNVRRIISRLHGIRRRIPESHFWNQASAWVPEGKASSFNQAVMELGALICLPSRPLCPQCPVFSFCEAGRRGTQDRIPAPRASRLSESVELVTLVLRRQGEILLTTQRAADFIPGDWALPSELLSRRKSPEDIASSVSQEILGIAIPLQPCTRFCHSITYRRIRVHVFYGEINCSVSALDRGNDKYQWASQVSLDLLLTSSLFRKALDGCRPR